MNIDDLKKLVKEFTPDMPKNKKTSFKRKVETRDIKGVIDISMDDEGYILKEEFKEKPIVKGYKYWILKLDRYYKNPAMKVSQLNIASLKMYASLCQILEAELNKEGSTVARLQSKLHRENFNYDIYYTLYLIAETSVINYYNPLSKKTIERPKNVLYKIISKDKADLILDEANRLKSKLDQPSDQTKAYFNLTYNNKVSLWWDIDGKLREKYHIDRAEENAVNQISKRNNNLWKDEKIKNLVLDLYVSTLRIIFNDPIIKTDRIIKIVKPYNFSKLFLDNLLILTEARVRDAFTFLSSINDESATKMIKETDDGRTLSIIRDYQNQFISNLGFDDLDEIYRDYFKKNPNKLNDLIKYLHKLDLDNQIIVVNSYKDIFDFKKLIKKLINDKDININIMGLFYYYKNNPKASLDNKLSEIINIENKAEFIRLVKTSDLSLDTIVNIKGLKKPKLKEISLNKSKINKSRDDLSQTVDMVSQFYEEDDEDMVDDKYDIEDQKSDTNGKIAYKDILLELIKKGYIPIDDIKTISIKEGLTANTYIGEINSSLFDYIGDQALILNGDRLEIDEFYVDMIKELINAN